LTELGQAIKRHNNFREGTTQDLQIEQYMT